MEVKGSKLYLGGISAEDLAKQYGTPLYVYEEDVIRQKYRDLVASIPYKKKKILYACKANTNIAIMKVLKEEGCGIDAVSPGEVFLALKAGFSPKDILFTGNSTTAEDRKFAVKSGVLVNMGSLSELEKFGKEFPGSDVCVRVNPDIKPDVHPHLATGGLDSKFGIYVGYKDGIKEILKKYKLNMVGIHAHIGTTIMELAPFRETMDVVLDAAKDFPGLKFIDFGGGIGIPYKPDQKEVDLKEFGRFATEKMEAFCKAYGSEVEYRIEPGRYLVCQSSVLLARVTMIKENPKKKFVGVDTSMSHLVRPAMYGSYHEIMNASDMGAPREKVDVVGNVCESGDFLGKDRMVQKAKEGDVFAIRDAGAYGYAMSSEYCSFPRPAEVMVSKGNSRIIRERKTFEDFLFGQKW